MQLELTWHCGSHHGSELFHGDLLAYSAAVFFRYAGDRPIDGLTPAARLVLRRTAASQTEAEIMARRYALAWLAFSEPVDRGTPGITIAVRRAEHGIH
jgi:hypothetical protein